MKKILLLAMLMCSLAMQANHIYCVETCPAENTTKEMNVSWATDTTMHNSYVLYTEATDATWRKARRATTESHLCTTFDSIYSKTTDNQDYYERHIFFKCGATLPNLKKDTEYMYRIIGEGEQSGIHRFKTAGAKTWTAAIISDFHTYSPLPKRLVAAMTMVDTLCAKSGSVDWILHLGDVTAWGGSYSFWKTLYREPLFSKYMWAGLNGNHDDMSRKYTKCTNDYFRNVNHYPQNGYEGEMGVCYYFYYGDALFVVLNNEDMRKADGLEAAQNWFRKVMQSEQGKYRYLIVCEHYQWFYGNDGKTSQFARWNKLFDEYGVDLALAGNNHIYVRTAAIKDGKATDGTTGTVYVQSASSDNERGNTDMRPWTLNRDIICKIWEEGAHTVGGMLLDATKKDLTVTLYDRYGTQQDQVVVPCKR